MRTIIIIQLGLRVGVVLGVLILLGVRTNIMIIQLGFQVGVVLVLVLLGVGILYQI